MKRNVFLMVFIVALVGCKKTTLYESDIVCNWKGYEWQNDIGNGSTPFSTIPADKNYFMHFSANGDFNGDYIYGVNAYNKYKLEGGNKIILYKNGLNDSLPMAYQFESNNSILVVSFFCIEACRLRLKRH